MSEDKVLRDDNTLAFNNFESIDRVTVYSYRVDYSRFRLFWRIYYRVWRIYHRIREKEEILGIDRSPNENWSDSYRIRNLE